MECVLEPRVEVVLFVDMGFLGSRGGGCKNRPRTPALGAEMPLKSVQKLFRLQLYLLLSE